MNFPAVPARRRRMEPSPLGQTHTGKRRVIWNSDLNMWNVSRRSKTYKRPVGLPCHENVQMVSARSHETIKNPEERGIYTLLLVSLNLNAMFGKFKCTAYYEA